MTRALLIVALALATAPAHGGVADPSGIEVAEQNCIQSKQGEACREWLRYQVLAQACQAPQDLARVSAQSAWALGQVRDGMLEPCASAPSRPVLSPPSRQTVSGVFNVYIAQRAAAQDDGETRVLAAAVALVDIDRDASLRVVFASWPDRQPSPGSKDWILEPGFLLLRAQHAARTGEWPLAAKAALGLVDRHPLDRRALAARLVLARYYARLGDFSAALRECAAVQRAPEAWPEYGEASRFAALLVIHAAGSQAPRKLEKEAQRLPSIQRLGALGQLAATRRGTVLAAGRNGAAEVTATELKVLRDREKCAGIAESGDGQVLENCSSGLRLLRLAEDGNWATAAGWSLRKVEDGPEAREANRWLKGQAARAWIDDADRLWLLSGSARELVNVRVRAGLDVAFRLPRPQPLDGDVVTVVPAPLGDGSAASWAVAQRPRSFLLKGIGSPGPGDHPPPKIDSKNPLNIADAAVDELGWIYLVTSQGMLIVYAPERREIVGRCDSAPQAKDMDVVAIAVDAAGRPVVALKSGELVRYGWKIDP